MDYPHKISVGVIHTRPMDMIHTGVVANLYKKISKEKTFCLLIWASITAFSINGLKKYLCARFGVNASKNLFTIWHPC